MCCRKVLSATGTVCEYLVPRTWQAGRPDTWGPGRGGETPLSCSSGRCQWPASPASARPVYLPLTCVWPLRPWPAYHPTPETTQTLNVWTISCSFPPGVRGGYYVKGRTGQKHCWPVTVWWGHLCQGMLIAGDTSLSLNITSPAHIMYTAGRFHKRNFLFYLEKNNDLLKNLSMHTNGETHLTLSDFGPLMLQILFCSQLLWSQFLFTWPVSMNRTLWSSNCYSLCKSSGHDWK